jgi:hypothetical protein
MDSACKPEYRPCDAGMREPKRRIRTTPLVEVLPHIRREIDEELRPLVRHASDDHPSATTTGEAAAD